MERSLQGLPPMSKSKGPHCSICMLKEERIVNSGQGHMRIYFKMLFARTVVLLTDRASPIWMIFPSWLTCATASESSHISEATYLSTLKPRSFRTTYPETKKYTGCHLLKVIRRHIESKKRVLESWHLTVTTGDAKTQLQAIMMTKSIKEAMVSLCSQLCFPKNRIIEDKL